MNTDAIEAAIVLLHEARRRGEKHMPIQCLANIDQALRLLEKAIEQTK